MANKKQKKPFLLYLVILVLILALAVLGGLTVLSSQKLAGLQKKVTELMQNVEALTDSAKSLSEKAQELEGLTQKSDAQASAATPTPQAPSEGTLSPSQGSTFTDNTDAEMDALLSQIQGLLPANNGSWSVYVCNLALNSQGSINNAPMQAASLIKLYIMGAVYENYESLSQQYGAETLDSNLNAMITVSDNDAANTLVGYLGGGDTTAGMNAVNQFCTSHGFQQTSMGRLLLASNENGDNYTSVEDCGKFMKAVYQLANGGSSEISLAHADAMYALLNAQTRRNKIPAQIPEGVSVANKTGELADVENDAAIIYNTPKGKDLVICFMSENVSDAGAAQTAIAQNSRMIYGYYNE